MPVPRSLRGRVAEVALAALAFLLALAQRPGLALTDTKVDLHVDPGGFLGDVLSAWSDTGDLGHVQGGQYGGYAWPMAPFYALGHWLGIAPWLVQRLWLGALLALAAWGAVKLADALAGGSVERAAAGALYLLNPYVVIFTNRTSITLLAYAALPWLMLCAYRAVREPRRWLWPAAFALLVTSSGGGVNAAVIAWVLLGPLLLALYEAWTGAVPWRAIVQTGWRTAAATLVVSLWWIAPLLVQSRYGVDFLAFTEQPGTIWSTTSLSESLRLMGYWVSYLGVGYSGTLRPYFGDAGVMLFKAPVVLATLLVPALAVAGLAWTRRRRYAPFCLLLLLVGLLVMSVGFPEGTPLRRGATFTYNHVAALQFLRTTHKAGPLVAIALALLGAMAAAEVWRRRRIVLLAGAALVVLSVWPLARGRAVEDSLTFKRVPPAWQAAARHVDARGGRALVLPGQLYANYDWGGTVDALLPAIADTPVATRFAVPYSDLRATDLLWTTDALVQQQRALPGQLGPLLDLMSVRTVVTGADDDRQLSGAIPPSDAAGVLGPDFAGDSWGPVKKRGVAAGTLGTKLALPEVRAWDTASAAPLVRLQPAAPPTVVDGGADALADLAAFGRLPGTPTAPREAGTAPPGGDAPLLFAPDVSTAAIRGAGQVVIADGNRRQVLVVSRLVQNAGATLAADDPISPDAAVLDPFGGADTQTVAVLDGVKSIQAPFSPGFTQFPEHRPYAALDGDPATYWEADRNLEPDRHWLEVDFTTPRDVPYVDLTPYDDHLCTVLAVSIDGRRYAVRPGTNRVNVNLHGVSSLRVQIAAVRRAAGFRKRAGGIRELRIPGVQASEALRPPVDAERALAGHASGVGLTYLFQRTTGDDPFRRDPWHGPATAGLARDRSDGESGLQRVFSPPAARSWSVDGWVSVAATAPDSALDRLAGVGGDFESSARFEGRPAWRASSAFDGSSIPWIGSWLPGHTTWLSWTTRRDATVRALALRPVARTRVPTLVRLNGVTAPVRDGRVSLPHAVTGRAFKLEILRAAFPHATSGADRQGRDVGIAELAGSGLPVVRVPRTGALRSSCGDLTGELGGRPLELRVEGSIAALDGGRPMRAKACSEVALPAGETRLSLPVGTYAPYVLRLRGPAAGGVAAAPRFPPGRVVSAGTAGRGSRSSIRLALTEPAWLVFGEAFNRGWTASCDGRDLGAPVPIDGYAMGWRVSKSCRDAELAFAPNRTVLIAEIVSGVAALALLGVVIAGWRWRRRRAGGETRMASAGETRVGAAGETRMGAAGETRMGAAGETRVGAAGETRVGAAGETRVGAAGETRVGAAGETRVPVLRAAIVSVVFALAFGFAFAARATPLFALGLFVILWRGVPTRALLLAAGGLLVVAVPVLTLAIPVTDRGGYDPEYAGQRVAVHWVAAAAVALLIVALVRLLMARRGAARSPA